MTVSRRSFLGAILTAGIAPAIVKAENISKIFVPKKEIFVGRGFMTASFIIDQSGYLNLEDIDYENPHSVTKPQREVGVQPMFRHLRLEDLAINRPIERIDLRKALGLA